MTLNAEHMCISRPSPSTKYHICLTNSICMSNSTAVVAVQCLSHVRLSVTPWTAALQASLSFTIFQNLLKVMAIELTMSSNHFILRVPFSSCPQFIPACFPMSGLFTSSGQSIGASASVLPKIRVDFL